jgi:uncharacterized protein YkwD
MATIKSTAIKATIGLVGALLLFGAASSPAVTASPLSIAAASSVKTASQSQQALLGGVALGDSLDKLLKQLGKPARIDASEQGYSWYVYNSDPGKLMLFGVTGKRVVAQFSNSSKGWTGDAQGIKLGQTLKEAKKRAGTVHGSENGDDYWAFVKNSEKSVLFIDKHDSSKIIGILRTNETLLSKVKSSYSSKLQKPFELQIFDLASAERKLRGIAGLTWDKLAAASARGHSTDMMNNDYFDHQNLQGLSPFDRMEDQGIEYHRAAENIAAGYPNAIYAHYGWMNSTSGHREALLDSKLKRLGTGVSFGGTYQVYYTQNFYTP